MSASQATSTVFTQRLDAFLFQGGYWQTWEVFGSLSRISYSAVGNQIWMNPVSTIAPSLSAPLGNGIENNIYAVTNVTMNLSTNSPSGTGVIVGALFVTYGTITVGNKVSAQGPQFASVTARYHTQAPWATYWSIGSTFTSSLGV